MKKIIIHRILTNPKEYVLLPNASLVHKNEEFRILYEEYGLTYEDIELFFDRKKPLSRIIFLCEVIKAVCEEYELIPQYDKRAINAVDVASHNNGLEDVDDFIHYYSNFHYGGEDDFYELIEGDSRYSGNNLDEIHGLG